MKNPIVPILGFCAMVQAVQAASVTWSPLVTTVNESNISTAGTFIHAGSWGTGPDTVGDITFERAAATGILGANYAICTGGNDYSDSTFFVPPGDCDIGFDNVMDGIAYGGSTFGVTVQYLIPGATYQIQLFASDDRSCCHSRSQKWSDSPTSGAGHETAAFVMDTSPSVIGTFTADSTKTQKFYALGVGNDADAVNAYVLRLITLPNPTADSDGDGLTDGDEVNIYHTNPLSVDTDGDGLSDGAEINTYHTDPLLIDTDGDSYSDGYEVSRGSDPKNSASFPDGVAITVLGTGSGALVGHDITDRGNDGSPQADADLSGFDWLDITATEKPSFGGKNGINEGAFDIFDNVVGGGDNKYFSVSPSVSVTVNMGFQTKLTMFTVASANDFPERDPRVWAIEGSNDGTTFTPIFSINDPNTALWTQRGQVLKFDLEGSSLTIPFYQYFRYHVTSTGTNSQQISEIEFFGIDKDSDNDGIPDYYAAKYGITSATADLDGDGLNNLDEFLNGTRPDVADTDGDGVSDGAEVHRNPALDPLRLDSDGDGIGDGLEISYGTDPADASSVPTFDAISWGSPQNITGALTDFAINGTKVLAWTGGSSSITINNLVDGGSPLIFVSGPLISDRYSGFEPQNISSDPDYETLLNAGSYSGSPELIELRGLTVGRQYQLQIWYVDDRDCCAGRPGSFGTDPNTSAVDLLSGSKPGVTPVVPAQYVIGTFTAQHTVQPFYSGYTVGAQYNALMLRDVTGATPPATNLVVTGTKFESGAFKITVAGLSTTSSYKLTRSADLATFTDVAGSTFTPTAATQTVSDPTPPAGKAFYRVVRVSP